ncbi:response regulator [Pedobacter soli]|uniref:Response regulator receiver domain-containing protein n=1 Tax=Pedobacter soli TaxID=390242 RepID=A0A1G6YMH0_9SPHI|nr:response regulator [Pedobacter soli]SDD90845.1 Response regulator receiver domain-containing protein [Pedobacter soli]
MSSATKKASNPGADVLVLQPQNAEQQQLLSCLKENDVSFKVVQNETEAFQILEQTAFKLIIVDLAVLENSEFSLVHKIRAQKSSDIPVVAIIPQNAEALQSRCFEAGVTGCFTKPISKIEVMGILTQFLQNETFTQQTVDNESGYETIDLTYLKEVSMGDVDYEREMTAKFIEIISTDLEALDFYLVANRYNELKAVAHKMLSTIYVMGLGSKVSTHLHAIEFDHLSKAQLVQQVQLVATICKKAKEEAQAFLNN